MRQKRIIVFDISDISTKELYGKGIYKITNIINNHFYIGSTTRSFRERFKEHCRYYEMYKEGLKPNLHEILWKAYDKYNIINFKVEILKQMQNCSEEEILYEEEQQIKTLKPHYNICQTPTQGGKPNKNRKLTAEWKQHITEKSKLYKHSQEILQIVSENNKKNAVKLQFIKDDEVLNFNSWVEAMKYFGNPKSTAAKAAYKNNKLYKGYTIIKLTSQKKRIKVYFDTNYKVFESFNECDRYLNMWRGYTSTQVVRNNKLLLDRFSYEII